MSLRCLESHYCTVMVPWLKKKVSAEPKDRINDLAYIKLCSRLDGVTVDLRVTQPAIDV